MNQIKNKSRLTDIGNKLVVIRGDREGGGVIEELGIKRVNTGLYKMHAKLLKNYKLL